MNNQLTHVLIVDDDVVNNLITSQRLKEFRINKIGVTQNGKEAIDYLDNCEGFYPDLVLLDLNMPVMNGFEVLEHYHKSIHLGNTSFAIVSSSTDEADRTRTAQYDDVIDQVLKPLTKDKIQDLVDAIIELRAGKKSA
ncbi:MAG: response regulator [Cyclobacteriaceae bacterium]